MKVKETRYKLHVVHTGALVSINCCVQQLANVLPPVLVITFQYQPYVFCSWGWSWHSVKYTNVSQFLWFKAFRQFVSWKLCCSIYRHCFRPIHRSTMWTCCCSTCPVRCWRWSDSEGYLFYSFLRDGVNMPSLKEASKKWAASEYLVKHVHISFFFL